MNIHTPRKQSSAFYIAAAAVLTLIAITPVQAATMPNQEDLRNQIIQGAVQGISQSSNSTEVVNSGDNTNTNTSSNTSSNTEVNNSNTASVTQEINAEANTGYNEASRNISIGGNAGIIMTGDATVNTQAVVRGNNSGTSVNGPSAGSVQNNGPVINTGDGTTTNTSANSSDNVIVNNGNTLIVNQSANTSANTGNNKADRNISIGGQAGVILTGNASANSSFLIAGNGSVALVGGNGNGNGPGSGASIILTNTGDNGHFHTSANKANTVAVNNSNSAAVSQSCGMLDNQMQPLAGLAGCSAVTGNNTSDRGIAVGGSTGIIHTSDATVNAGLYANLNRNNTSVSGNSGSAAQGTDIVNTGDGTQTSSSANSRINTGVNNSNSSSVSQKVNAVADTGHNTANRNISIGGDAGVITTGNATVNAITVADVNGNATSVGTPGSTNGSAGNGTSVVNSGNSTHTNTSANTSNQTQINNANSLDALQSLLAWLNSGYNSALGNIGN